MTLNDEINQAFTNAAGGTMPHNQIIAYLNTAINTWEKEKRTEFAWNRRYYLLCKEGTTGEDDCKKHVFLVKFELGSEVVAKFRRCNEGIQVKEAGQHPPPPWRLFEENMMDMNGGRRRKSRRRKSTKSKKNVRRRTARY